MIDYLINHIRNIKLSDMQNNLKENWYLPVTAVFFFLLYARVDIYYYYGIIPAFIAVTIFSLITPSIKNYYFKAPLYLRIYALINAFGICYCSWSILRTLPFVWGNSPEYVRLIFMILAIPAAFFLTLIILNFVHKYLYSAIRSAGITKTEYISYTLMLFLTFIYIFVAYSLTQAFYTIEHPADIIFTTDSPILIRFNAYIILNYIENDIKQSLFAVYASPFMGVTSLISEFCPGKYKFIVMDFSQVILLLLTNILLAIKLQLKPIQRILFTASFCCSYTYLIFSLAMEQYVVCYFWLVLTVCMISDKSRDTQWSLSGAGGTLLTSLSLAPFVACDKKLFSTKTIVNTIKIFAGFFVMVLLFCRFDVLMNSIESIIRLRQFSGESVSMVNKLQQYTHFVADIFTSPYAGPSYEQWPSWQLNPINSYRISGIIIFILAMIAYYVNRHEIITKIAGMWIIFSLFVLTIVGWGTSENGLILYSLYFGWAFFTLFVKLITTLEDKTKKGYLTTILFAAAAVAMLITNIPAIGDLLTFAMNEYP